LKKTTIKKHHAAEHHNHRHSARKKTNYWKYSTIIIAVLFIAYIVFVPFNGQNNVLSDAEAAEKTIAFIDTYMLQGASADFISVHDENGVYRVRFSVQGQEYDAFSTADGKYIFPQGINVTQVEEVAGESAPQEPETTVPKADVPVVELFVMSHCPYGTQIEKGILPVLELFGDKIDFELKFVYYAMHGEKELQEQMKQYCIQKEMPNQFTEYLSCFLKEGDTTTCLDEVGIDTDALTTCVADVNDEFNIMADFNDQSTWVGNFPSFTVHLEDNQKYNVGGSPTLVVNGVSVPSGRSPAALQAVICSAFSTEPEECATALSTTTPGPGFGFDSTGSATTAECG
jgi:glutaredoxin